MNYKIGITIWKGVWTWIQTAGVMGATGVLAIEWPEDPEVYTKEMWVAFLISLIPAVWRVLENWRKNSRETPRWNWPWKLALIVLLVPGCATTSTVQTDPDGNTVEFKGRAIGKANINNLKHQYSQKADEDGNIETIIGQSSDSIVSDNADIVGDVVSSAFEGIIRGLEIVRTPKPAPVIPKPKEVSDAKTTD
jgi:hypothetical protein